MREIYRNIDIFFIWGLISFQSFRSSVVPLPSVFYLFYRKTFVPSPILAFPVPIPYEERKLNWIFIFKLLCVHKTFWGTTKKCKNKDWIYFLLKYSSLKCIGQEGLGRKFWTDVFSLFFPLFKECYEEGLLHVITTFYDELRGDRLQVLFLKISKFKRIINYYSLVKPSENCRCRSTVEVLSEVLVINDVT